MMRMNEVQPQIAALQKKYANDKEKLNIKMSELYRKEKINPLSGCLPMLIQLPVLWAMFEAMRVVANEHTISYIQAMMKGTFDPKMLEPFLWIKSIFQPDSFLSTIIPAVGDKLQHISPSPHHTDRGDAGRRPRLPGQRRLQGIAAQYGATPTCCRRRCCSGISASRCRSTAGSPPAPGRRKPALSSKLLTHPINLQQRRPAADQQDDAVFFPLFSVWICASYNRAFALYWCLSTCSRFFSSSSSTGILIRRSLPPTLKRRSSNLEVDRSQRQDR